jgi:hypothetical protein
MRIDDSWPDRVYIEASQSEKVHNLYSKSSEGLRDLPFKSLKEVILAAALIGFNLKRKERLDFKKEIIFTRYLDGTLDLPLVICMAIADKEGDVEIMNNKKEIIEIFQEYIKGGFDALYDIIKSGGDEIQNYAHYLLETFIEK